MDYNVQRQRALNNSNACDDGGGKECTVRGVNATTARTVRQGLIERIPQIPGYLLGCNI